MDEFRVIGGSILKGVVSVSGAKNSALPCLAASLLTSEPVILHNVPYVRDLITMRRLLEDLGARILVPELRTHRITASTVDSFEAPYELVKTMRASVLVLGPLLARYGQARVSLPGGCAIGQRPIDLHLKALEQLGAKIDLQAGVVEASASRLQGTDIAFDSVTVTGTENIMMAATLASGTTRLRNAACEPEIVDLAELLVKMGARINGAGTTEITIEGRSELGGGEHSIIADRIETGTLVAAAAITRGELEIRDCIPGHLEAVISQFRETGIEIEADTNRLYVRASMPIHAADISTEVYPGFPTDMQAQYMAVMTQAEGEAEISETIFENRFMHVSELQRLGADVRVNGNSVRVSGPRALTGARVMASDLRASASLVLAALVAKDETRIERVYHIDRGYEAIEEKLCSVGASIERIKI